MVLLPAHQLITDLYELHFLQLHGTQEDINTCIFHTSTASRFLTKDSIVFPTTLIHQLNKNSHTTSHG